MFAECTDYHYSTSAPEKISYSREKIEKIYRDMPLPRSPDRKRRSLRGCARRGENTDYRAIADSSTVTAGCCKRLTADEIYDILTECK